MGDIVLDPGAVLPDTDTAAVQPGDVQQRDLYFKIELVSDTDEAAGVITYGFTNEPVPIGYRSTVIPGVYVWIVDARLRGLYIQRRLGTITKIALDGTPTALN